VGLVEELVHATYDRHDQGARLLLALDELANVAPLPRLASIVSEGGGQGVLTLACLQDLSQARNRWGASGEGFLSLFPTTVVLPGIADRPTLELLQHLAGRSLVSSPMVQVDRRGKAAGYSTSWVERDRATLATIAQGRPGYGLGLDAAKSMKWIELTPAYQDERFRGHLDRSDRSERSERSRDRAIDDSTREDPSPLAVAVPSLERGPSFSLGRRQWTSLERRANPPASDRGCQ
jgi:hypothetical protein